MIAFDGGEAVIRSESVERVLADSLLGLPSIRGMYRIHPRFRQTERHVRFMGGGIGLLVNMAPFLHLWRLRGHRFERVFLGSLVHVCLHAACGLGRGDIDHEDVEQVLWRWAAIFGARPADAAGDRRRALVAAAVSKRLAWTHFWMLLWGFLPGVGALAGYLIRAREAQRCRRVTIGYFESTA